MQEFPRQRPSCEDLRAKADGAHTERERRAATVASSDNKPGQRARLCLEHSASSEEGRSSELRAFFFFNFISGITVFDVEAGSSGHGRVFTSEP